MVKEMKKIKITTCLLLLLFTLSISTTGINAATNSPCWERVYPTTNPVGGWDFLQYDIESDLTIGFEFDTSPRVHAFDAKEKDWIITDTDMPEIFHSGSRFAYHEILDAFIFFGGTTNFYLEEYGTNQTWAYFYNNNSWIDLNPSVAPPPRSSGYMVYDSYNEKMVMFSGINEWSSTNYFYQDIWSYDHLTNIWTNETPTLVPEFWYGSANTYDSDAKKILVFGGAGKARPSDIGEYSNELWEFDLSTTTWTELSPSGTIPSKRGYVNMAYDKENKKTILFGGTNRSFGPGDVGQTFNDTYAYDYDKNEWIKLNCSVAPHARFLPGLAYNSKEKHILLHAGGLSFTDTWIFTCGNECGCTLAGFESLVSMSTLILLSFFVLIVRRRKKNK